ncbi:bifunctional diguanylate cyclase/phosphodiesterase [Paenibacillus pinistramenti]|uniref:bifunctional diguanylate cyclase/phosphodiesterase n=1 Tax=Paenibacillus pinistramenti TaxID=1768003 RepID=UPI001EF0C4D6|nr:bifunctional diguanylate cyclase/phosphodiesterase [Paenibacillus pinistramenti]
MEESLRFDQPEFIITAPELIRAMERMGVGLIITNPNLPDNPVIYVNQGFKEMTGYEAEDVLMRNCRCLQGPDTSAEDLKKIKLAQTERRAETVTLKNYRKDGTPFWNQLTISPVFGESGELLYFIGLQFDITKEVEEKENSSRRIRQLAFFDSLTGLLNMSHFKTELEKQLQEDIPCAVIRLNIDRFRYINESYGDKVGDSLLLEAAERMKQAAGKDGILCRSFADDFIVLLKPEKCSRYHIHMLARMLADALHKPHYYKNEEIRLSYSIGISMYPDHGNEGFQLLNHADLALKKCKQENIGEPYWFHFSLLDQINKRIEMEKKLPKALENEEFELYFQPKCGGSPEMPLAGAEVLLRWNDPEQGLVPPMDFIPIAEENGFIIRLGEWILSESCRLAKAWQEEGYPKIPVSVNVSAAQFKHPHFIDMVEHALVSSGLEPKYLELEVTETMLNDPVVIKEKLERLRSRGIKISIDDFGTGYSSIHYLKTLPIDILKIDKSFVQDTPMSKQDSALLVSIIQLGKSFGLTVLAEGVESKSQLEFLAASGCDLIQGYYYSRPLNREAMEQLFRKSMGQALI